MKFFIAAAALAAVASGYDMPDGPAQSGEAGHPIPQSGEARHPVPPHFGRNGTVAFPGHPAFTTEVVDTYVTFCPEATVLTFADKTYTVTAPTTFTITDCPCTVTKPVLTTSTVICEGGCGAPTPVPAPAAPPAFVPAGNRNSTGFTAPASPAGQPGSSSGSSGVTPSVPIQPGSGSGVTPNAPVIAAADKAIVASGAGLVAFLGLAVFVL